ncbi:MAG: hypothetical protein CMF52_03085 [Legionellales bacterium]|nr:hypothetical protein [Legionellales bacterium]|tara:strand:+ start:2116 stop:2451 length:336 start_codon:yes stop_codon:yes gene_type:complete
MSTPQRINIQYSIDFEELPAEVTKLYDKAIKQYGNINLPKLSKQNILSSSNVLLIDEARKALAKTDIMLSDAQSIINSYVEYELSLTRDAPQQEMTHPDQQNQVLQNENAS